MNCVTKMRFADGSIVRIWRTNNYTYREVWYNEKGLPHRDHGLPTILVNNGQEIYYKDGFRKGNLLESQ